MVEKWKKKRTRNKHNLINLITNIRSITELHKHLQCSQKITNNIILITVRVYKIHFHLYQILHRKYRHGSTVSFPDLDNVSAAETAWSAETSQKGSADSAAQSLSRATSRDASDHQLRTAKNDNSKKSDSYRLFTVIRH